MMGPVEWGGDEVARTNYHRYMYVYIYGKRTRSNDCFAVLQPSLSSYHEKQQVKQRHCDEE